MLKIFFWLIVSLAHFNNLKVMYQIYFYNLKLMCYKRLNPSILSIRFVTKNNILCLTSVDISLCIFLVCFDEKKLPGA